MPDISNIVPLVKAVRVATGCGLSEAKPAVRAAIAAGLGMPGLTRETLEQALLITGTLIPGFVPAAAARLLELFPDATDAGSNPIGNLRVWLHQAKNLGDHALVPLPGATGGAQLTVLDLRILLEEIETHRG